MCPLLEGPFAVAKLARAAQAVVFFEGWLRWLLPAFVVHRPWVAPELYPKEQFEEGLGWLAGREWLEGQPERRTHEP